MKKEKKNNYIKYIFIIFSIMFAVPSIIYYINNKTILGFDKEFRFLLNDAHKTFQTFVYVYLIIGMIIVYYLIIKNKDKIFKNTNQIFKYIAIISLIFVIVIPFWCSDVFYYLGIGRLYSEYEKNPYYTTIKEYVDSHKSVDLEKDTVLKQGYNNVWSKTTVVYGPIWTSICGGIAKLSFGNIDFGLLIFKLINALVHILNCYMIYKIWNKKTFTLMYGLNPFVLIEGISNVHNDMFVLLFILVATYMLVKKKNIWATVVFLSLAAAIKYFAILLLPIFVLYYYKDKKLHTRMLLGGACILFFVALVLIFYLPFVEDFEVFKGMQTQQGKLAKSMYVAIRLIFPNYATVPGKVNRILILTFIILYFIKCLNLLIKKEIKIEKEMREHTIYLMIFLFLLITNFQPWYLIWLFYCIFWQKKENVFYLINLCLSTLFANCVFLLNSEAWTYGGTFFGIILVAIIGLKLLGDNKKIRSLYGKISFD